jgi:hypothetical protein
VRLGRGRADAQLGGDLRVGQAAADEGAVLLHAQLMPVWTRLVDAGGWAPQGAYRAGVPGSWIVLAAWAFGALAVALVAVDRRDL